MSVLLTVLSREISYCQPAGLKLPACLHQALPPGKGWAVQGSTISGLSQLQLFGHGCAGVFIYSRGSLILGKCFLPLTEPHALQPIAKW